MAISEENKDFINNLIEYYISESKSYCQMAKNFLPDVASVSDATFGIITGCIYSSFLHACQSQQQAPSMEDMKEFNAILKKHAAPIKKSIAAAVGSDKQNNNVTG